MTYTILNVFIQIACTIIRHTYEVWINDERVLTRGEEARRQSLSLGAAGAGGGAITLGGGGAHPISLLTVTCNTECDIDVKEYKHWQD